MEEIEFEILNFEKIKFYANGDSPKTEYGSKVSFRKLIGIITMVILSHHMCDLGKNWRRRVVYKSENVKVEFGLAPPHPK